MINQIREVDFYWFEGCINPLTTSHDFGYFLYYPTKYFRNFLDSCGIAYEEDELEPAVVPRELVLEYIAHWTEHFSDPEYFWRVKDRTAFDQLRALSMALYGKELKPEDYTPTKASVELKKQKERICKLEKDLKEQKAVLEETRKFNRQLEKEKDSYRERLEKTQSSMSWKVTKPLREAHKIVKH